MSPEVFQVANSRKLWLAALPVVIIVAIQAIIFTRNAAKAAKLVNLSDKDIKKAFKVGALSSIGPALGVFLVMLGLMSVIGGPLAWMRLSVIGAAPTELTAAQMAAESMGSEIGASNYGLIHFAGAAWIMALNGAGWLVFSGLFADKLDLINDKLSGGNVKLTAAIGTAATCGAMAYLLGTHLVKLDGNAAAAVVAGFTMIFLNKLAQSRPKLKEYNLGLAMVAGMIGAVVFNRIA